MLSDVEITQEGLVSAVNEILDDVDRELGKRLLAGINTVMSAETGDLQTPVVMATMIGVVASMLATNVADAESAQVLSAIMPAALSHMIVEGFEQAQRGETGATH